MECWFTLAKKESHAGRNYSIVLRRESNKIQPQTFQNKENKTVYTRCVDQCPIPADQSLSYSQYNINKPTLED